MTPAPAARPKPPPPTRAGSGPGPGPGSPTKATSQPGSSAISPSAQYACGSRDAASAVSRVRPTRLTTTPRRTRTTEDAMIGMRNGGNVRVLHHDQGGDGGKNRQDGGKRSTPWPGSPIRRLPVDGAVCYGGAARHSLHPRSPSNGESPMERDVQHLDPSSRVSRRRFLGAVGTMAGVAALPPTAARAQAPTGKPADPAS